MTDKIALITGINGQDGSYLAELLLVKEYKVFGLVKMEDRNLKNVPAGANILCGDLANAESIKNAIKKSKPDEIYNLAGISDLKTAFRFPEKTLEINYRAVGRLLDEAVKINPRVRFLQASSSEIFHQSKKPLDERSSRNWDTDNPYAKAKMMADRDFVSGYRKSKNIFACSAILFNHESPRRPEKFVTRKITRILAKIKLGLENCLYIGNIDAKRDWGFAGDYVEAMWEMLQQDKPNDFVIATGAPHSIKEFIEAACEVLSIKIKWQGRKTETKGIDERGRAIVQIDPQFYRPAEKYPKVGDNRRAKKLLNWKPRVSFENLIKMMVKKDLEELRSIGLTRLGFKESPSA